MKSEKAQVSLEMIILAATLIAIILLLTTQLQKLAQQGTKTIDKKATTIFKQIEDM
ncbi:MAG: hypothetical protein QXZ13_00290 [Candidatus Diapherotrites archaeon]